VMCVRTAGYVMCVRTAGFVMVCEDVMVGEDSWVGEGFQYDPILFYFTLSYVFYPNSAEDMNEV
jgi:hypothetical protein